MGNLPIYVILIEILDIITLKIIIFENFYNIEKIKTSKIAENRIKSKKAMRLI